MNFYFLLDLITRPSLEDIVFFENRVHFFLGKKIEDRLHQNTSKLSFQHILKTAKEKDEKQKALGI